ncbi:MAG: hypothetical protein Q9163_001072 [Psora crenata]
MPEVERSPTKTFVERIFDWADEVPESRGIRGNLLERKRYGRQQLQALGPYNIQHPLKSISGNKMQAGPRNTRSSRKRQANTTLPEEQDCAAISAPEATWNEQVHSRLLHFALRGSWERRGLWYQNITTARISNQSLIPSIASCQLQSKLVDYAILIRPDNELQGSIVSKLKQEPTMPGKSPTVSINAASQDYIRFNPIGVSIETKREAGNPDEAVLQLGKWTIAQLNRLKQLINDESVEPPAFPLVIIVGHSWRLFLAHMTSASTLSIMGYILPGDTNDIAGLYKVIAAVRRLAEWVDQDYRIWFKERVLNIQREGVRLVTLLSRKQ